MHICFMSTASQNNLPEMAMTLWPPYKYTELKRSILSTVTIQIQSSVPFCEPMSDHAHSQPQLHRGDVG